MTLADEIATAHVARMTAVTLRRIARRQPDLAEAARAVARGWMLLHHDAMTALPHLIDEARP